MEPDSWTRFWKRHQSALQSRHDLHLGFEDADGGGGGDESRAEFPCPFCGDDFDLVGLCCHIDEEHQTEARNGVCPVCAARVGMDMVAHITMQHGNFFKISFLMQRRRRFRRGACGSHSTLSLLRKELREGNIQALLGGSSYTIAPPSNAAPDPLLSSLIYSLPVADSSRDVQPESLGEDSLVSKTSDVKVVESVEPTLSKKDQKERALRSKFVQGLLLSTIFDDYSL
ncbi:protein DEHYDRATION-INDUCED 19-like protein 2-like isoform X1 [Iris pallida]|uniref:Protein DEHYDRATION-INDUCED 19-like protein 2-like isoform X1 n=1 Tax=Iris pallida TaxID=29817 RepID=A0AAX6F8V6_IRIPA|nr:protein DEHYDRATION-INDUCED 19-like protein 2-like isoform X1 [Iris pallida]